jgi:MinD-like ATPase involved in chromosome partitioning or flagellar assembly
VREGGNALIRCGVLGQAGWATTLQGDGLQVLTLGEDLRSFRPEQYAHLDALIVTAAAVIAAGVDPAPVHTSLRRLLPGCMHVCVRVAEEPPVAGWPADDVYTWPVDAFRLFSRLHGLAASSGNLWWEGTDAAAAAPPAAAIAAPVAATAPPDVATVPAPITPVAMAAAPVAPFPRPVLPAEARTPTPMYLPHWPSARSPAPAAHGQLATGQAVSVIGAKGGVGQTWVAVNLAVALASQVGMECLLADLDLACADVAVFLGLLGAPTLVDVVQQRDEDGWPWSGLHQLRSCPLRVLTGPERPQMASLLTPASVTETVRTLQERFAYTVCDHAPGDTDPLYQAVSEHATATVLVTTLDAPALRQAKLRLEHLRQRGLQDRTHVVLNQIAPGGVTAADGAAYLEHTACTVVPLDRRRVEQSIHEARPVALQPRSEAGRAFFTLAAIITGVGSAGNEPEPQWRRWLEQLWKR